MESLDSNGSGPFIGKHVSDTVRKAKYPVVWRPLIEVYASLKAPESALQLYCSLCCTVITKKVMMVDMFYLYEPPSDNESDGTLNEDRDLREAHMITATRYLVKMLNCMHESIHGRLPNAVDAVNAASMLYAELYAEAFDIATVRERDVFDLVQRWFQTNVVLRSPESHAHFQNVAPGVPFLFSSHVYWLWLHLTAARVHHGAPDLLTVIYAMDTIVYCDECKKHFLQLRTEFFFDRRDGGVNNTYCRLTNAELLFAIHNKVNSKTGSPEMDRSVLSEYKGFWEK